MTRGQPIEITMRHCANLPQINTRIGADEGQ